MRIPLFLFGRRLILKRVLYFLLSIGSFYILCCVTILRDVRSNTGRIAQRWAHDQVAKESSYGGICGIRSPSQPDVNTFITFPELKFQPANMHTKRFWDSSLEQRYLKYKEDKFRPHLKVIVLPHSHADPGWLKTFEGYYDHSVRNILDNMVNKLTQHKNMTFIWTEIAFFSKWWESADSIKKGKILQLVNESRLEFTSGTWVMTDEANPHLYSMLDQMIEGHQWLKSNLGVSPKSAWTIDPFGHGPVAPYLLKQAGLQNTVIQRIHYGWKRWMADHQMSDFHWEMPWKSSSEVDSDSILCHHFPYDLYSFKHSCGPDLDVCVRYDFRNVPGEYSEYTMHTVPITEENVKEKAEAFLAQSAKTGSLTTHNVVLNQLGDDFRYDREIEWDQQYDNYQKLFHFINSNRELFNDTEIGFGTLTDYFDAIRKRVDRFPTLTGDFFPYADIYVEGTPNYWTGYFTSRPFLKMMSRELESRLRGTEILFTIASNRARQKEFAFARSSMNRDYERLVKARRWLALFQHHDAITGTSQAYVMKDYGRKLFEALQIVSQIESLSAAILLSGGDKDWQRFRLLPTLERPSYDRLPQKMTLDLTEDKEQQTVVLYNSEAHFRHEVVRLKISWPYVRVVDPEGQEIPHQINPEWKLQKNNQLEAAKTSFRLVFIATLAPLSLTTFRIQRVGSGKGKRTEVCSGMKETISGPFTFHPLKEADIQVENKKINLLFNHQTGFLRSIRKKSTGRTTPCAMQFAAYPSTVSKSGAYLFMPNSMANESQIDVLKEISPQIVVASGPIMSEVSVMYNKLLIHSTFILHDQLEDLVWMETTLDMGQPPKYRNHEFFIRLKTGIQNSMGNNTAEFCTDQNGFTMARRSRVNSLGIEANYYPMTSAAFIQDDEQRLNLLVNSAKGFSSITPGWMEFMIDRRTSQDDGRGMSEGMTDNLALRAPFILLLEDKDDKDDDIPSLSVKAASASMMLMYPATSLVAESEDPKAIDDLSSKRVMMLNQPLPCNAHLMGLRTLSASENIDVNLPSSSALMTVHNRAFACSIPHSLPLCGLPETNDQVFYPGTDFVDLELSEMHQTSLTGLKMFDETDFNDARVPQMELRSFNLKFA